MKASELTGRTAETLDTFAQVEHDADHKFALIGDISGAGRMARVNTFTGEHPFGKDKLRENEQCEVVEYRTKRLALEAWDELEATVMA